MGRATILENNIVQTTGSAGESVAGGVIFTLPALIFLGFQLEYTRILLAGHHRRHGSGVLFMIPLRRQLIVKEHGNLLYPEGTACADVLIAGDKGGSFASRVFYGLGLGGVYTLFQNANAFAIVRETPDLQPAAGCPAHRCARPPPPSTSGVGYIIGPKIAGVIFAGGVFSWLVMMPAIKFFGSLVPTPIYPSTIPIAPDDVGPALAVLHPLHRRGSGGGGRPHHAGQDGAHDRGRAARGRRRPPQERTRAWSPAEAATSQDLPMTVVLVGSAVIVRRDVGVPRPSCPCPARPPASVANVIASVLVVVFGFLFVTVSSRIAGLIGTSSNPISGMAIATLMATCALFLRAWAGRRPPTAPSPSPSAAPSASRPRTRATRRRT